MSFAVINMAWVNNTTHSFAFETVGKPEHGTVPEASVDPMTAAGTATNTSTVRASSNSNLVGPGPEGTYQWKIVGTNPTLFVQVSYNHPFGTGTTWVTVQCPAGFQVQGCGQGPSQTINLNNNCATLQDHDNAHCQVTVTQV